MNLELIASTNNLTDIDDMIELGKKFASVCYSSQSWEEIKNSKKEFKRDLIGSGHHSVFEHIGLTFNLDGMSKALAMILNNEKQYATSEKSARYTQMKSIEPTQKVLYDKWMESLIPEIAKVHPDPNDKKAIKKIAQENARYMTSVFTPTKLIHTVNLRQLNFLQQQLENFSDKGDYFKFKIGKEIPEFLEKTSPWRVPGLDNQTDRHLSFFADERLKGKGEEIFSNVYSTSYDLSFAGLAQAHRHRTISYGVLEGIELGAKNGFFVPPIVKEAGLEGEWVEDLKTVAKYDLPQAQLLRVQEEGTIGDFRSKTLLRMCGHAQLEIMYNTLETAKKYKLFQEIYGKEALKPKCTQKGLECSGACAHKGAKALKRKI